MPKLGYNNEEGKLGLSYSKLQVLHRCHRLYQITQKNNHGRHSSSIIFAFGHAVAAGVQSILAGNDLKRATLRGLADFNAPDIWEVHKSKRSMAMVMIAIEKFFAANPLDGWIVPKFYNHAGEVVSGIEFFCQIDIDDSSSYQLHIDCILYNPEENEFLVLELKTTGRYAESNYKNSAQTLGYSLCVDWIVDHCEGLMDISDPEHAKASNRVLYFVFDITEEVWQALPLLQTSLAKANFIQGLLLDREHIAAMERVNYYPKNGDSCNKFNRDCEFYNLCDQQSLTEVCANSTEESAYTNETPSLVLNLQDILTQQLAKAETEVFQTADPIAIPNIHLRDDGDFSL